MSLTSAIHDLVIKHMKDELAGDFRSKYPEAASILIASGVDRDEYHVPYLGAVKLRDGSFALIDCLVDGHDQVLGVPVVSLPDDANWVDQDETIFDGMPKDFFVGLAYDSPTGVTQNVGAGVAYLAYEIDIDAFLNS